MGVNMSEDEFENAVRKPTRGRIREKKQPSGDYAVGYCKPPNRTQFKKGQSGHRGRRKRNGNLLDLFKQIVAEKVGFRIGETVHTMTRGQAVLEANYLNALRGNQNAMQNCFILAEQARLFIDQADITQTGGFLFVPAPMTLEEWEATTANVRLKLNNEE
jgi:hypothetical protein